MEKAAEVAFAKRERCLGAALRLKKPDRVPRKIEGVTGGHLCTSGNLPVNPKASPDLTSEHGVCV
jgi:hypothetical protein